MRNVALLLALLIVGACAGPTTSSEGDDGPGRASTSTWEPYTRHLTVNVDGQSRGYLVSYDPIPLHAKGEVTRALPTGAHRILDEEFRDVGFVTPNHEVHRHGADGRTTSLGVAGSLDAGLALFYQGTSIELRPLAVGARAN